MKDLHLVCNAHLDPVWLWEWQEGMAEAISTFRVAAELCEEFDSYVFNHNEAVLYQWIEENEPELFTRIQTLVKKGNWHIMGGFYLQPDCNMPDGESFARQLIVGNKYFADKFGIKPTTAINLDPFGHSRGIAQILAKYGYDSYLFCRPGNDDCPLENEDFLWIGFDGSSVKCHRAAEHYNSALGHGHEKILSYIERNPNKETGIVLWGVGNHGGGPSKEDLIKIGDIIKEHSVNIIHSTPEAYFAANKEVLPKYADHINRWAVGCYTSQINIKKRHRKLENELYMTEKMLSIAKIQGLIDYPDNDINEVEEALLFSEFHDILPGSSIETSKETALIGMDYGIFLAQRAKNKAFLSLAQGEAKAEEGTIPILVYNPHPFDVETVVECEFQLADQNWKDEFTVPTAWQDGIQIPSQCEKEMANINLDWRKRIVFTAKLKASSMNRFDCKLSTIDARPTYSLKKEDKYYIVAAGDKTAYINCQTGLIDKLIMDGKNLLGENSFNPLVIRDNPDPWGMTVSSYADEKGSFALMSAQECAQFCGTPSIEPIRIIEDGAVRTTVEVSLLYNNSAINMQYKIPKLGTYVDVCLRLFWQEKDSMLKLAINSPSPCKKFYGQTMFGTQIYKTDKTEEVMHKWCAMDSENDSIGIINNGIYGVSGSAQSIYLSLVRSPAHSSHPIGERPMVLTDRFTPRIDQGEFLYDFKVIFTSPCDMERLVEPAAMAFNQMPFALSFFPSGKNVKKSDSAITITNDAIRLSAFKKNADGNFVIRLFNSENKANNCNITVTDRAVSEEISFTPYALKEFLLVGNELKEIF